MSNTVIIIIAVILIFSTIIYVRHILLHAPADARKPSREKREIALQTLSKLWAEEKKEKNIVVSLDKLSCIWREKQLENVLQEQKEASFTHNRLQKFYDKHIKNSIIFKDSSRKAVMGILKLLDDKGDCPSVTQEISHDPDCLRSSNEYDMLAQVTLLDHSIDTAEEMLKLYKNSISMMPKLFIAALAHDVGKIPSYHQQYYAMGDHPVISARVLLDIEGYNELPYKDDINKAIVMHHKSPVENFGKKLKEADGKARQEEILKVSREQQKRQQENIKQEEKDTQKLEPPKPEPIARQPNKDHQGNLNYHTSTEEHKIEKVDISWLNPDELIAAIKPYINKIINGFFYAFSMKNGYVYVQTGLLEEKIKKLGSEAMDQTTKDMSMDKSLRQSVLLSVAGVLREKGFIANDLIKRDYFGGRFVLKMKDGTAVNGYFTPFNADAFSNSIGELEAKKEGRIREIESVEILGDYSHG
jgi:hypothetical protein